MRNIKLTISYDGTNYLGWQKQKVGPTIQGVLEDTLKRLLGHKIKLRAAGRTDAGVHALGQVANFLTTNKMALEDMHRALNALLPRDISIVKVEEVPIKFNAQYDARYKTYFYQIYNHPIRNPIVRLYSWWVPQKLDIEAMKACVPLFVGQKDFASFKKAGTETKTTVRTVLSAELKRVPGVAGMLRFEISGRGFLRYMVRNIVGALVEVGLGKLTYEELASILEAKDRSLAPPPAPPQGLFLKEVIYKDKRRASRERKTSHQGQTT
ncbi:tRNA pseudouridine synthase A [Thermodesulfatator indicus DSM 15286]|uniref:tRNA pseudouridine synthase A n=1 Tax=Thermodesulfatator indicus (strain DSM 15286 / JCM 11887 / CIR29812) TaxID=667014 RepID=F8A9L6_THEID|nr:tRNA pseudouridine(38-40) synthase TruA [Thermodesulfatator indicus]AEH45242.1 tRNA pseudouridine synthase A [Thermodesulfatator indicus DSM 15286]